MALRAGHLALVAASVALLLGTLTACAPEDTATAPSGPSGSSAPIATGTGTPTAAPSPSASASAAPVSLPTDCAAMLPPAILAQLVSTPLNDPALGVQTGVQSDGGLICIWRDPAADTTYLSTTISRINRGPALDMLNELADAQGFNCYSPAKGVRCEKTWQNAQYPVTDGRTLFWRDDVLIDTQYSNLAPPGYTDGVIASLWG